MNLLFSLTPFFSQCFVREDICRVSRLLRTAEGLIGLLHSAAPCQSNSGYFTWPSSWFKQLCSWGKYKEKEHSALKQRVDLVCGDDSFKRPFSVRSEILSSLVRTCRANEVERETASVNWKCSHCFWFGVVASKVMRSFSSPFWFDLPLISAAPCTQTLTPTTNWKHI